LALELTVGGIDAGYGAVRALHDFSLFVKEKETVALLGTNGNGKSTLMKCVMGMVRPTKGSISLTVDGKTFDLTKLSTEEIVNLGVALVPEGRRLFPKLTVEENLLLGAFRPQARADIGRNLALCYETFEVLGERRRQLAGSMSGGQQQMLAIARALMMQPDLLILDEPTLGLAPVILEQLSKALERLRQTTAITVLLGEQNVTFALPHADRVYVLEHARIVWEGDPSRFATEMGTGYL